MRLLIADTDGVRLTDVVRRMEVVRLGQDVDTTGMLQPAALERAFSMAREYARQCQEFAVERMRFVATSATRDAGNSAQFVAGIRDILGIEPEVISGAEEATLGFRGAVSSVSDLPGPYVVVDIGGGSTEIVLGTTSVQAAYSMDVGCVRMYERHLASDPPTAAEVSAATQDIQAAIATALSHVPVGQAHTLVGVAGSVTTVTAHALGLPTYDPDVIDHAVLSVDEVLAACAALLHMPKSERARQGYMHPGRVDVIGSGALVWSLIVRAVHADMARAGRDLQTVATSEHDILDGIALALGA